VSSRDIQERDGRRAFSRGFHQRSPLVLAAAALITLLALVVLQGTLFEGGLTLVDEGRLLRITHDDYVHVSVKVQELKKDPPKTRTVYLFGGSGTMECFVSEASLAGAIAREAGQPVRVVSLAAHQESMGMTLALVDNLPEGPATLAIGLAPIRVTGKPSRDATLLSGHELHATHYYPWGAKGHTQLGKRRNVLYVLAKDVTLYRKYGDYNFAMLEEVLKLAGDRGFDVVFYDQPLNASAAGPTWNGVVPAYRERASQLAEQYGVPYVHIERNVELTDHDFADLFHLLAPARLKWQPEMARQLAATLPPPDGPVAEAAPVAQAPPAARLATPR